MPSLVGDVRAITQSTDLASHERFSVASGRASIERCEGQGIQTPSLAPRAPHPGFKSGTFYFAEKREFLFCVDIVDGVDGPKSLISGQRKASFFVDISGSNEHG